MSEIRIGIIGAGRNATGHAQKLHDNPRAKVTGIADINEEAAKDLAAQVGAKAVTDYRDLFDDADAIVVASPNFLHREQAVASAEAGKHVFCEKPMGLNYTEAKEISDAIAKAGVRSSIGFSVRWQAHIRRIMEMSRKGDLGQMIEVFSQRMVSMNPHRGTGWRGDHGNTGGVLLEINIHEVDWMMAAAGDLEAVYARFHAEGTDNPRANDYIWLMMEFKQGATGMHQGSWSHDLAAFSRSAQGTEGGVATGLHGKGLYYKPRDGERQEIEFEDDKIDPNAVFVDAIESGEETEVNHEWGLKVMQAAEAFCLSAKEKRRVLLSEIR